MCQPDPNKPQQMSRFFFPLPNFDIIGALNSAGQILQAIGKVLYKPFSHWKNSH